MSSILRLNGLEDGCYAEPFCGGAGVALELLFAEQVRRIHLNDVDKSIYAFWKVATQRSRELCDLIEVTPVTLDVWRHQKSVQASRETSDELALAFSTFFLNRTNRSGILTAGAIGGLKQDGNWKIDARYNKAALIERVDRLGAYRDRIAVTGLDVIEFLDIVVPQLPTKTLVYLDPPYYRKAERLYLNHFTHDNHSALAARVQDGLGRPWMVSYDNAPQISLLYSQRRIEEFALNYSAQAYVAATELMIYDDNLRVPESVVVRRTAS